MEIKSVYKFGVEQRERHSSVCSLATIELVMSHSASAGKTGELFQQTTRTETHDQQINTALPVLFASEA